MKSLIPETMDVETTSILNLPLPILDTVFDRYSSGKAQKLALLASVCKTFSVPGRAVSVLSIDDSVNTKSEGVVDVDETQVRLSRLVHLTPNVTKVTLSVEVSPSTLSYWSRSVGRKLTALEIPNLNVNIVEVLHTFPILEELKVTLTYEDLLKEEWNNCQNILKITKLEVRIERPRSGGVFIDNSLISFLKLFPDLITLTVKSVQRYFIVTIGHSNVSSLILDLKGFKFLTIDCPNLKNLRLVPKKKAYSLHLKTHKFATEVEIVEDLDDGKVEIKCEVEKESFDSKSSRCLAFNIMMRCTSMKRMSIDARELLYLYEYEEKFWFPDVYRREEDERRENFNLSLDVPIKLEGKLSSPSFEELKFTSKNRLDEDERRIFDNRYNMLKELYPNIIFSCRDM